MRVLAQDLLAAPISASPAEDFPDDGGLRSVSSSWVVGCHGVFYNLSLIVPSALFVAYLALQARRSFSKLIYGRSNIIIAYYALLWIVSVLNFLWCILQVWECSPDKGLSWNILSLFTKSGLLFMEVSLLAFLLQGNNTGGFDDLTRTFVVSGVIVAADVLLKVIYIFGFGVPLFIDNNEPANRVKWGLWVMHRLLVTAVYGLILYIHHSKWRERLPARPAYYNYICVMLLLNVISLFACMLAGNGAGFGFWLLNLSTICYHSVYLPLLYKTFLADFFQEEDMRLENVYYSEMKDAGFFDADWD